MKDRLDNFLLAILWLLASTLGACFWFNIRFGFNIFSSKHWHHLAYMQAVQTPVNPTFYISTVITVFVIIFGLYLIIRPRFRRFKMPIRQTTIPSPQQPAQPRPANVPAPSVTPAPAQPQITSTIPEQMLTRPPRLNIAVTPQLFSAPPPQQVATPQNDWSEIRDIFESAGYTFKGTPRIGTITSVPIAIGTGEVLWLGAIGIPTSALGAAIDTLNQIFSDTLDNIIININGFVIDAPDAAAPTTPGILTFDTPASLRQYMSEHTNPPLAEDDIENFDAFSAYISTVIDYIGKI